MLNVYFEFCLEFRLNAGEPPAVPVRHILFNAVQCFMFHRLQYGLRDLLFTLNKIIDI